MRKENRGITLLALVITVIILLILAAITLNSIIGGNGIFRKAQYAKEQYENAQEKEKKELNQLYSEMLIATNDSSQIMVNIEDLKEIIQQQVQEELKKNQSKSPTGTIISYMGTKAPEGYLFCDGRVYNISEYSQLAEQIKDEFGRYNYWGGDGQTTFAVPNLQGEFLRGYSTSGEVSKTSGIKTGAVGTHQDATWHSIVGTYYSSESDLWVGGLVGTEGLDPIMERYQDISAGSSKGLVHLRPQAGQYTTESTYANRPTRYTSRPTNTIVLYCIKY